MGIKRAAVIGLMRGAFRRGQSQTSFYWEMRAKGLAYRKSDLFADWRSVNELETKKGLMQYVRKGYYPTKASIAAVDYNVKWEFMYVVKVKSRLYPGDPLTDRMVNITSDAPMTSEMVSQAVIEKWSEWEDYTAEALEEIIPWTAMQVIH